MKLVSKSVTLTAGLACLASVLPTGPRTLVAGDQAPELAAELEPLRPFLGSWIGHFDDPEETMEVFVTWSEALGGQAIREVRTVPDAGAFESETLYYVDRESKTISHLGITSNGYVSRGSITLADGHLVIGGRQVQPDASAREMDGTYTFRDDGTLVNVGGHTIVFQRR